jgi:hypothetical protein
MYDGKQWVSDFFQGNFYANNRYKNSQFQIHRAPK